MIPRKFLVAGLVLLIAVILSVAILSGFGHNQVHAGKTPANSTSTAQASSTSSTSTIFIPSNKTREGFSESISDSGFSQPAFLAIFGAQAYINVTNSGTKPHTFTINNTDGSGYLVDTGYMAPGESMTINFTIPAPGNYTFYSRVPGDIKAGLSGQLVVLKGPS